MVSEMLQNSTTYFYSTKIFSFNKNMYSTSTKVFSFSKNIYSTSTKIISFNKNIYSTSTKIFIQLQQKYLFNFNKNIYSTSTKNNFIQQQSSRTFKISSFNKIPRPSPVEYKTALSHASNISKACQTHN